MLLIYTIYGGIKACMEGHRKSESIPRMAYSVREARLALGIDHRTLEKLIRNGRIATTRIQSKRLVPIEALKEFLLGRRADAS